MERDKFNHFNHGNFGHHIINYELNFVKHVYKYERKLNIYMNLYT